VNLPARQELFEARDADVAQERLVRGVQDGEVGELLLVGGVDGAGDAGVGARGEGGGRLEVFNGGLCAGERGVGFLV
jgi:hypothetical protein